MKQRAGSWRAAGGQWAGSGRVAGGQRVGSGRAAGGQRAGERGAVSCAISTSTNIMNVMLCFGGRTAGEQQAGSGWAWKGQRLGSGQWAAGSGQRVGERRAVSCTISTATDKYFKRNALVYFVMHPTYRKLKNNLSKS